MTEIFNEELKDYDAVIKKSKETMEFASEDGKLHFESGKIYIKKEKWQSAISEYEEAISKGYKNVEIYRDLAWLYVMRKDHNLAIRELKKAIELKPEDGWLNLDLGKIYSYGKNEFDSAIQELKTARAKGIDNEEIAIELGKLYREEKEYELSIKEFSKVLENQSSKSDLFFKNKILSEIELSQRNTILRSKPRILTVSLATVCNLSCIMCEVNKHWKNPWELPEKSAKEIMECFPYLEYITWSGGEVFLYRYFKELFEKASQYPKLRQEIVTNGLLIDRDWAERLAQSNLTLIYSIDGFSKEIYESIRKGARFQDLLKSLSILNKYRDNFNSVSNSEKINLVLNFVVMKSNLREIEKAVDFAVKHRFNEVRFAEVKFLQDKENIFLHRDKEALSYIQRVMPDILKKAEENKIVFHNWFLNTNRFHDYIKADSIDKVEKTKEKIFFCYLPWKEMYIEPGGWVRLQCFCNQILGNVCEERINDIWNGKIMQNVRKKILECDCSDLCDSQCISGVIPRKLLGFPWDLS